MKLLIVDDEPGLRHSLRMLLEDEGHSVSEAGDGAAALARAAADQFDAILCDVRMPALEGGEFLRRYRGSGGTALVIMMSAYGSEESAIAAMKEGAYDYIAKPFRADEVLLVLRKAEERERLFREVELLRSAVGSRAASPSVVAESAAMRDALDVIAKVAPHRTTVLLTGPSGSGKEVLARELHRLSPRSTQPFVAINCAAIPEALLESELFGHVRGAFTGAVADRRGLFEQAAGGTLLLDEIGDLPPPLQAKLLRVLQDGEFRRVGDSHNRMADARLVAATARDLEADVSTGRFREDLFYRLNVVAVRLPALSERPEDIPPLIRRFLEAQAGRLKIPVPAIETEAMRLLLEYRWPGNVRELQNVLERAIVLAPAGRITARELPVTLMSQPAGAAPELETSLKQQVEETERRVIEEALRRSDGNRRQAARLLGISVRNLFYKIRALGIGEDASVR